MCEELEFPLSTVSESSSILSGCRIQDGTADLHTDPTRFVDQFKSSVCDGFLERHHSGWSQSAALPLEVDEEAQAYSPLLRKDLLRPAEESPGRAGVSASHAE